MGYDGPPPRPPIHGVQVKVTSQEPAKEEGIDFIDMLNVFTFVSPIADSIFSSDSND